MVYWVLNCPQKSIRYFPPTPGVPNSENFMDKAFKSMKYSYFQKVVILSISIQSFNILSISLSCYTILESIFDAYAKVPLSGHFKWLSQCQDWFTKKGCHSRILKLETWNFAWDTQLLLFLILHWVLNISKFWVTIEYSIW